MTPRGELFGQVREKLGNDECAAMLEFWARALQDSFPDKVDTLYLFGQMPENEVAVLEFAEGWYKMGHTGCLCVPDQHGRGNPPHAELWIRKLVDCGISRRYIFPLSAESSQEPNTQTECGPLLRLSKTQRWRTLGVTAAAFHLPRALHTVISEILRGDDRTLRVYGFPAAPGDWTQIVTHSNGRTQGPRAELIFEEMLRMATYENLVSPSEALAYLNARDR